MRVSYSDTDGSGARGGGPAAVIGRGVALKEAVDDIWRVEVALWKLSHILPAAEHHLALCVQCLTPLCISC